MKELDTTPSRDAVTPDARATVQTEPKADEAAGIFEALRRTAYAIGRHLQLAFNTLDAANKLDEITRRIQEWF